MKTTFYLVRHGESLGNMTRTFLGHTDLDLSELGYKQAELTAKALENTHFDYIYSSDLIRAYNTAVPIAKSHNLEINTNKNFRELHAGRWEGKNVDQILAVDEDLFINGWRRNFGLMTLPGGEAVLDAGNRFLRELELLSQAFPGAVILVASHAAVIRSFWSIIIGLKPEEFATGLHFPGNASYSIVEVDNGVFKPIEYSISSHLGELATYINEKVSSIER